MPFSKESTYQKHIEFPSIDYAKTTRNLDLLRACITRDQPVTETDQE